MVGRWLGWDGWERAIPRRRASAKAVVGERNGARRKALQIAGKGVWGKTNQPFSVYKGWLGWLGALYQIGTRIVGQSHGWGMVGAQNGRSSGSSSAALT